jgi:hypothetical protein
MPAKRDSKRRLSTPSSPSEAEETEDGVRVSAKPPKKEVRMEPPAEEAQDQALRANTLPGPSPGIEPASPIPGNPSTRRASQNESDAGDGLTAPEPGQSYVPAELARAATGTSEPTISGPDPATMAQTESELAGGQPAITAGADDLDFMDELLLNTIPLSPVPFPFSETMREAVPYEAMPESTDNPMGPPDPYVSQPDVLFSSTTAPAGYGHPGLEPAVGARYYGWQTGARNHPLPPLLPAPLQPAHILPRRHWQPSQGQTYPSSGVRRGESAYPNRYPVSSSRVLTGQSNYGRSTAEQQRPQYFQPYFHTLQNQPPNPDPRSQPQLHLPSLHPYYRPIAPDHPDPNRFPASDYHLWKQLETAQLTSINVLIELVNRAQISRLGTTHSNTTTASGPSIPTTYNIGGREGNRNPDASGPGTEIPTAEDSQMVRNVAGNLVHVMSLWWLLRRERGWRGLG